MSVEQPRPQNNAYRILTPVSPVLEPERPHLDACLTNQPAWLMPADAHDPYEGTVDIVKEVNPTHAYMAIPSLERKSLDHHGPGWGYVSFGVLLPRLADGVYQMPRSDNCDRVAIKCLNKRVVELALKAGVKEDPYNEIRRMHTIGDNVHVLGCIEALHDETFLYIIMPYCEEESIASCIPRQQGLPEHQARRVFGQIVENLMYLRHYRICHRDLSPDNCMIYKGRAVFNDLARSFQVPPESSYVYGMGAHGKPAFLAPEVFVPNAVFNAFGCDLWAAMLTLFYLLTGEILYLIPQPTDLCFCYFVLARGISRTPSNEMFTEILQDLEGAKRMSFWRVASKCLQLSPEALEVLDNVLRMSPQERWDVDAVAASAFMNPTKKPS